MEEVRKYINRRYYRWRDYAMYHAIQAGTPDDGEDVLNEVVLSILEKDPVKLIGLYEKKHKDGYTELDYYALRMIKLNLTSKTSPWKHKKDKLIPKENLHRKDEIDDYQEDQALVNLILSCEAAMKQTPLKDVEKQVIAWRASGHLFKEFEGKIGKSTARKIFINAVKKVKTTMQVGVQLELWND